MSSDAGSGPGKGRLALVFVGGPVLAVASQSLTMAGIPWACVTRNLSLLHLVPAAFLVAGVALTAVAWTTWSGAGRQGETAGRDSTARSRFLALNGLVLSAASTVLMLGLWVPLFVFDPCVR